MDSKKLHTDILAHLSSNPVAQKHIGITSHLRWTQSDNGLLQHNNQIYVPEARNLWLQVLQYKHNHVLSGHFGQNKILSHNPLWIYMAWTPNLHQQPLQVLHNLYAFQISAS